MENMPLARGQKAKWLRVSPRASTKLGIDTGAPRTHRYPSEFSRSGQAAAETRSSQQGSNWDCKSHRRTKRVLAVTSSPVHGRRAANMRSVVALAAAAALALLCPTASAQEYSYPEYERAEKFTAPCGWKHTGSSTAVRGPASCPTCHGCCVACSDQRASSTMNDSRGWWLTVYPRAPQDVSDWARKKPWFTAVKAHMNEYIVSSRPRRPLYRPAARAHPLSRSPVSSETAS